MPKGGPDGGDGGDGGSVLLLVDDGLRTLLHLRHQKEFSAEAGRHGEGNQKSGRRGRDCTIRVPPGTIVRDQQSGAWIADLVEPGDRRIVAQGGRGGRGNTHFKGPTRRTPRYAQEGKEGEKRTLLFELRLLADVGLVGLPNAGKSTLLARVSNARPRIGDYPFTTLAPNLGIVAVGDSFSFVMADIPGLVEGAHKGRGLGIRFLKHLERTRLLLFLVDSIAEGPEDDLGVLRNEIARFSASLAGRPSLVVFSRADLQGPKWQPREIEGVIPPAVSAQTGQGIESLLYRLKEMLRAMPEATRTVEKMEPPQSDLPFAFRIDRELDLGRHPWPHQSFVGPVDRWGELED